MSRRKRILFGVGLCVIVVAGIYWWMSPRAGPTTENIRHLRRGTDWREVYYLFEGSSAKWRIRNIERDRVIPRRGEIHEWNLTDQAGKRVRLYVMFDDEGLLRRVAFLTEEAMKTGEKARDIELPERFSVRVYNWLSGP